MRSIVQDETRGRSPPLISLKRGRHEWMEPPVRVEKLYGCRYGLLPATATQSPDAHETGHKQSCPNHPLLLTSLRSLILLPPLRIYWRPARIAARNPCTIAAGASVCAALLPLRHISAISIREKQNTQMDPIVEYLKMRGRPWQAGCRGPARTQWMTWKVSIEPADGTGRCNDAEQTDQRLLRKLNRIGNLSIPLWLVDLVFILAKAPRKIQSILLWTIDDREW